MLTTESSRTYLSSLWWILDPAMDICIYYLVLGVLFNRGGLDFISNLIIGSSVIRFFTSGTAGSAGIFRANINILETIPIKKFIFPATYTVSQLFKYCILLGLVVTYTAIMYSITPQQIAAVSLYTIPYFLFTMGGAFLVAGIAPFFPDFALVYTKLMMILFWVSGIFFDPAKAVPPEFLSLFYMNPVAVFISLYREALLHNSYPIDLMIRAGIWTIATPAAGLLLLKHFEKVYPRVVMQQ
jgi:ABC-type polysaccharide/polyol phosphate export permease